MAFSTMWSGIRTTVSGIYNTIKDGFNKAVGFIKGLASQAFRWGADLIGGIVKKIRSCIGKVTDAGRGDRQCPAEGGFKEWRKIGGVPWHLYSI